MITRGAEEEERGEIVGAVTREGETTGRGAGGGQAGRGAGGPPGRGGGVEEEPT